MKGLETRHSEVKPVIKGIKDEQACRAPLVSESKKILRQAQDDDEETAMTKKEKIGEKL